MMFVDETDLRYYLAESTLPNAGYGCFAKEFLKKDDWLEVIGVYVKNDSLTDQCTHYGKRYKFAGSPKFNAKILPMGFGGMVNHSDDQKLVNCCIEYAPGPKRSQHAGQVIYRFLRDIHPDEELVGNYGPSIGKEIKKFSENLNFLNESLSEWDRFLNYDLYNLKNLFRS